MPVYDMSLPLHLLIHISLGLLAGLFVWLWWKRPIASFLGAFTGGVLVDFDHFFDYFLAFGNNFNLHYFIAGYQFLKSGKLFILFHGWEYVIILLLAVILAKKANLKSIFFGLVLGLFFHLWADVFIDRLPITSYSVINRARSNFEIRKLVYPEHWQKHLEEKAKVKF